MQQKTSPPSPLDENPYFDYIIELITAGATNASIVRAFRCSFLQEDTPTISESSIRRFRRRHQTAAENSKGPKGAFTKIEGDEALASTAISNQQFLDDPDAMLRQRGLDPEDWYIASLVANEWDGPGIDGTVTYYQTKFTAKRLRPERILQPVRSDGWQRPLRTQQPESGNYTVVIVGDHHAPFHDRGLHNAFLAWLEHNKPDHGVHLGDLVDFQDLSLKHPKDPENEALAQECLQSGYDILRGAIEASPNTYWQFMPGNHDGRLRSFAVKNAPEIYGLRRVDSPEEQGEAVNALPHLMRLDELGVEWVDPKGAYEGGQVVLSPHLAVCHGWIVREGSGASALKSLQKTGYSLCVGHTHRQSVVHHTTHDIYQNPTTLLGCEIGAMCKMDNQPDEKGRRFPNYAMRPDWQLGFAVATLYNDGRFKLDLATYVNGTLLYRNQRY